MKLLEVRRVDSLTARQQRLLDELLARHPTMRRGDLVAYVIEGMPATRLLQRLIVAPLRDDVRPGDDLKFEGSLSAGASSFVLGDVATSGEEIEIADRIAPVHSA